MHAKRFPAGSSEKTPDKRMSCMLIAYRGDNRPTAVINLERDHRIIESHMQVGHGRSDAL